VILTLSKFFPFDMAAMKPQVVNVRGKRYFVCDYTGAPLSECYFIPSGKDNRAKLGTFATLPIMMRAVYEKEGGMTDEFKRIKTTAEGYFGQPDIPLHRSIPVEQVPMSKAELERELDNADMGLAWLRVKKSRKVPRDRSLKRARNDENKENEEEDD